MSTKTRASFLVLAALFTVGSYLVYRLVDSELIARVIPSSAEQLVLEPTPTAVDSRLLFGGDIMWGRRLERTALLMDDPYRYPFGGLESLERSKYQAWIANLECPSTDTVVPYEEQSTLLRFNCNPDFLPEFSNWFDVVSLSNNHTDNVNGVAGLKETREKLDQEEIQYFGHYDNSVTSEICEVVTVSAYLTYSDLSVQPAVLPLALCGYHGVYKIPLETELSVIEDYAAWLPTVVMPHMGTEYQPANDGLRQRIYRSMIDHGATAVVGGHPHWVQNSEVYGGELIMYSLGNLIFDQNFSSEVQRSVMLDMSISIDYNPNTEAWLQLAPTCLGFQDDCIAEARRLGLDPLEAEIDYKVVGTTMTDMVAAKATAAEQAAIEQRLDWELTSQLLELP